jgi:hypothetical protein
MRIDPIAEQNLRPVHIAHPGEDGLVHQEGGNRPCRTMDPTPCTIRIGVGSERIGTEFTQPRGDLGRGSHSAQLGTPQVSSDLVGRDPYPHLSARRDGRAELEAADEAEVNVQHPIAVELAEQVLAVCSRLDHSCLVQQRRRFREAALRAGDGHHSPAKGLCHVEGKPMQRVAFRQGPLLGAGIPARSGLA